MNELIEAANERGGWVRAVIGMVSEGYPITSVAKDERCLASVFNTVRNLLFHITFDDARMVKPPLSGTLTPYTWTTLQDAALGVGNTLDTVAKDERMTPKPLNDMRLVINKMLHMMFNNAVNNSATRLKNLPSYIETPPGCPATNDAYLDNAQAAMALETPSSDDTHFTAFKGYRGVVSGDCLSKHFSGVAHLHGVMKYTKSIEFPTPQGAWYHVYDAGIFSDADNVPATDVKVYHKNVAMNFADIGTSAYTIVEGDTSSSDVWKTITGSWPSGATQDWHWKVVHDQDLEYVGMGFRGRGFFLAGTNPHRPKLVVSPVWTQQ